MQRKPPRFFNSNVAVRVIPPSEREAVALIGVFLLANVVFGLISSLVSPSNW